MSLTSSVAVSNDSIEDLISESSVFRIKQQPPNDASLDSMHKTFIAMDQRMHMMYVKMSSMEQYLHKIAFRADLITVTPRSLPPSRMASFNNKYANRQRKSPLLPTSTEVLVEAQQIPELELLRGSLIAANPKLETAKDKLRRVIFKITVARRLLLASADVPHVEESVKSTGSGILRGKRKSSAKHDRKCSKNDQDRKKSNIETCCDQEFDPSFDEVEYEERQRIPFLPDSQFRIAWDLVSMTIITLEVGLWSTVISTTPSGAPSIPAGGYMLAVRTIETIFWFVDIWIQMNTARLTGWEIEEDPVTLRNKYFRYRFPFDLVISLPIDLILASSGEDHLSYQFMVLRVFRLFRVPQLLQHSTPTRETSKVMESIVFSFWLFVVIQACVCIWLTLATDDEQQLLPSDKDDPYTVYIKSFYFIMTTLSSVGYGDISPATNSMRLFNVFLQLLGLAVIMVISGRTGAYFITTDPYELVQIDRKRRLEHLMAKAKIPWAIQREAFTIYPSLLEAGTKDYQTMLLELPDFIQSKISRHIKVQLISAVPMFQVVSRKILMMLAEVLTEEYHGSKEYLIHSGEVGGEMFFLNHGMVEVLIPQADGKETWAATLKSGSWFGEIALLRRTTRIASIRSITSCVLFKLNKTDFDKLVLSNEELRTRLAEETDRRLEQNTKKNQEEEKRNDNTSKKKVFGEVGSVNIDKSRGQVGVKGVMMGMVMRLRAKKMQMESISRNQSVVSGGAAFIPRASSPSQRTSVPSTLSHSPALDIPGECDSIDIPGRKSLTTSSNSSECSLNLRHKIPINPLSPRIKKRVWVDNQVDSEMTAADL